MSLGQVGEIVTITRIQMGEMAYMSASQEDKCLK